MIREKPVCRISCRFVPLALTLAYLSLAVATAQTGKLAPISDPGAPIDKANLLPSAEDYASAGPERHDLQPRLFASMSVGVSIRRDMEPAFAVPLVPVRILVSLPAFPTPRFQLRSALRQEFEYLVVEHSFRLAQDAELRSKLAHDPFFHNWIVSFQGYDLKRWGDGDDFLVNDIAHPMQGSVAGWIYLQNSPEGSAASIGDDPRYWKSRLKAAAWAAAYEVQWKIGPLSETSIGNAGGWSYVPNCGTKPSCLNNPAHNPATNNAGLSDWVMTPVGGFGWIVMEDTIDRFVVSKVGGHSRVAGNILRSALEPTRNFAALFNGVLPWGRSYNEQRFVRATPKLDDSAAEDNSSWTKNRTYIGTHFLNISLPQDHDGGLGSRHDSAGVGITYGFRFSQHLYFDSEVNHFTGNSSVGPTWEGLFGAKVGQQEEKWGLFAKTRPGFIYYPHAWSGGENAHFTDLSRFAFDAGGVVELYPNRRSIIRIDIGTTLVRYLQDYPNPQVSPIGSILSTDYYITQGNLQISAGYEFRF